MLSFHRLESSLSENSNYFWHKLGYFTESRLSIINIHLLCCLLFFYCRLNLVIQFELVERWIIDDILHIWPSVRTGLSLRLQLQQVFLLVENAVYIFMINWMFLASIMIQGELVDTVVEWLAVILWGFHTEFI